MAHRRQLRPILVCSGNINVICDLEVSDLESACYIKIAVFWDLMRAVWETGTKVSDERADSVFSVEGGIVFFENFYLSTNSTAKDSNVRSSKHLSSMYWVCIENVLSKYRESESLKFNFMAFPFAVYDLVIFKHLEGFFVFLWRNSCVYTGWRGADWHISNVHR